MPLQKIAIEIDDGRLVTVAPLERMSRGEINITPIEAHQEHAVVRVYRATAQGYDLLTTFRLDHLTRFGRSRPVMRLSTTIGRGGRLDITVYLGSTRIARQTVDVSKHVGAGPSRVYIGVIALAVVGIVGAAYLMSRASQAPGRAAVGTRSEAAPVGTQTPAPRAPTPEPPRSTALPEPARPEPARPEPAIRGAVQPDPVQRSDSHRAESVTNEPAATVYFPPDSAELSGTAVRELEAEVGVIFDAVAAGQRVVIEGHCAPAGSREFLLALSRERAEAVAEFLTGAGLRAPDSIVGYGADRVITSDPDRLHLNRRVEIVLETPNARQRF